MRSPRLAPRVVAGSLALCLIGAQVSAHPGVHDGIESASRQLAASPEAPGFLARAELHRIAGEFEEAARDLERAAALDPGLAELPLCRAALAVDQGQFDLARRSLEEYLGRRPEDGRAYLLRSRVALREGRSLEAARDLGMALSRIKSPNPDLFVQRASLLMAEGTAHSDEALATLLDGIERLGQIPSLEQAVVGLLESRSDSKVAIARIEWLPAHSPGTKDHAPAAITSTARTEETAAVMTRGPYLARGTHERMTIRWRTDVSSNSRVRYGASPGNLTEVTDVPAVTAEHEVTLTGLSPGTRYYYSVGSTTEIHAGDDLQHTFVTAPPPGTNKPSRFWVIGDSGTANAAAAAVRDAFAAYAAGQPADLWLMLGDNAYGVGTDAEYQAAVFNMYPEMLRTSVLWPTRGNHDAIHSGANNDYYDIFTLPTAAEAGGLPSGTEAYYSFDYANVHFICLDSEGSVRAVGGPMAVWLRADLAATQRDWVIAYWHHPPYTKGSHDSDNIGDSGGRMHDMRQNIVPILDSAGVDLVLTGHSHSYERSFLIDGHYGLSGTLTPQMIVDGGDGRPDGDGAYHKATVGTGPREGVVHTVAGSSGQISGGTLNHPVMVTSLNLLGSMVIDVAGNRLDARFLDDLGVVRDSFAVIKGSYVGVAGPRASAGDGLRILGRHPTAGVIRFGFRLESAGQPRLAVLDATGRRVRLVRLGELGAGEHELIWDGLDDRGQRCAPGVYFAVLEHDRKAVSRKVVRVGP